jgi:putative heme transporter
VGALAYFGMGLVASVSTVALSVILGLFPAAILSPAVRRLERRGWRPTLATLAVLVPTLGALVAVFVVAVPTLVRHLEPLIGDVATALAALRDWLVTGPLGMEGAEVERYWGSVTAALDDIGVMASGLMGGIAAAGRGVTALLLTVVTTFFFLRDGPVMFRALVMRLPEGLNDSVRTAVATGWATLGVYMRGLALVGVFDAVMIGIGLAVVGVPMVVPLAMLTFLGSFIPLVGAWTAGMLAVAVAFVNGGLTDALIVLAIITAVQQVEGNLILPTVFGNALALHPLVVLLAVAAGGVSFGITGAFLAVPVVAVSVAVRLALAEEPASTITALAQGVDAA